MAEHAEPTTPPAEITEWLVDGYNAMHAVLLGGADRAAFWTAARREELISRIERFSGLRGPGAPGAVPTPDRDSTTRVTVVFDGRRPRPAGADAQTIAQRFEPSADDWIVRRVRGAETPGALGVVTSDRQVAGRCQHAGARVVSPRQFLAWCRPAVRPEGPDAPDE